MLTGRQPAGRFPMPSRVVQGLSDAVDEAVESMLAMEPSERPASIRDAWHQLQRSFSAQATTARAEVVVAAPKVEMPRQHRRLREPSAGEWKI